MAKPAANQNVLHDPEKSLNAAFPQLTTVPGSGSTLEDALDAEANVHIPHGPATDAEKQDDPGPPPNGGFQAWLQVLGSFFLFFNCWGKSH